MAPESESESGLTDQGKLLFGAGFVFGVTVTLTLLGLVLVVVTRTDVAGLDSSPVMATVAGGVLFAAIVGAGLFYLAFPENRASISVEPEQLGLEDEE